MTIVSAVLIGHEVPGWPEEVISLSVPLGKRYRVDLDSKTSGTLHNTAHPEWGVLDLELISDVEDGFPLPTCCLKFEA